MHISSLLLQNFRSHETFEADLPTKVAIIVGKNGSGKTNILEAIYALATGVSFRDADSDLTQYDKEWWRVSALVDGVNRELRYKQNKKSLIVDDKVYHRIVQQVRLPVVLFEPDALFVIHAGPSARRDMIDTHLSLLSTEFRTAKKHYDRAIRQRNRLLKSPAVTYDTVFSWDILLARYGNIIHSFRQQTVHRYNEQLSSLYSHVANNPATITAQYVNSVQGDSYEQSLLTQLKNNLEKDHMRGFTSVGPHRDDIRFYLNEKDMAQHASRGEIRSLVLALKQIEAISLEESFQTPPLILLDDVFSELDQSRQQQLLSLFNHYQVVITSTDVPDGIDEGATLISV